MLDLAYERGLIVYSRRVKGGVQGDYFMVAPPLIVTREQIGEIVAILGDAHRHRCAANSTCRSTAEGVSMATQESHHHLRGHRLGPHADDVATICR